MALMLSQNTTVARRRGACSSRKEGKGRARQRRAPTYHESRYGSKRLIHMCTGGYNI
jgi:hypothetical protein